MGADLDALKEDAERYANQLKRSSSRDEALEIAIKAAETSMQALKLAGDQDEKARLSTRFTQLLNDAERIKVSKDWRREIGTSVAATPSVQPENNNPTSTASSVRLLKPPESSRQLPKREQILLLKAGYLNGFKFPPWTNPPAPDEFELREGEQMYQ